MKKKYYLSMLSTFFIVYLSSVIYAVISQRYNIIYLSLITLSLIFILINWLGVYFIFAPIDYFLKDKINFEQSEKRINECFQTQRVKNGKTKLYR
jgi:hypothetical protein